MDTFRTSLAPISATAWTELERQARASLTATLSARRIVDVRGPLGWDASAINLGRLRLHDGEQDGVSFGIRQVLPLIELRVPFRLGLWELDNAARGALDLDLRPLTAAARAIAHAEDEIVFRGLAAAGVRGVLDSTARTPVEFGADPQRFPAAVASALVRLKNDGVGGPYALVVGAELFTALSGTSGDQYPLMPRLARLIDGPVLLAPVLRDGAVLVTRRGGDFELTLGQDVTLGYEFHDSKDVKLFFTESVTFRVLDEDAAVLFRPEAPATAVT